MHPVRRVFLSLLLVACPWPAMSAGGSVVEGRVEIFDREGERLDDLSGVVVFVDQVRDPVPAPQERVPKISHQGLAFSPTVLPVRVGDQVDFLNDDAIYHNAFSLSRAKPFDLGIYPQGSSKLVTFDQPGLVKVFCQIHPSMVSNILVLGNRLYAVTDERGQYRIHGVPAGSHRVRTWYELARETSHALQVPATGAARLDIRIVADRKRIQHKNKFGQPYRKKY